MLQKLGFLPGFNKQVTSTGAESQWTGGENVRFRYGTPEKIGGWNQLGQDKLTGAARGLHHFVNKESTKFAALTIASSSLTSKINGIKLFGCFFNKGFAVSSFLTIPYTL